jgi:tetratricopeptide (TPR) repeat protein
LPLHWPNEGANKESEHYLRRAIQLDPGSFRFHFHLAEILLIEDERSQARAAFRKAIELKPDFGPTHYQLGKLLAREGNNPLALEELEEAVREEPDLVQAYYQLSQVCARLGEVEKSKQMPVNFNRLKKEGAEGTQEFTGVVRKELEMP